MNDLGILFSLTTSPLVVCLTWAHILENENLFGCFLSVLVLAFVGEVHYYTRIHDDDIYDQAVFHSIKLFSKHILIYTLCIF